MSRDTRSDLLDAAQDLFATEGFTGTSIRGIASRVGIKESSVYNHFPSKQAVLDAVLARAGERLAGVAWGFGTCAEDPQGAAGADAAIILGQLESAAAGYLDLWLHDPGFVAARRVLTLEQYRTPEAGRLLRELTIERPLSCQAALFADLTSRGIFRPADPQAVALAFWGPILAILTAADAPDGESLARERLRAHLGHFRQTYSSGQGVPGEGA